MEHFLSRRQLIELEKGFNKPQPGIRITPGPKPGLKVNSVVFQWFSLHNFSIAEGRKFYQYIKPPYPKAINMNKINVTCKL